MTDKSSIQQVLGCLIQRPSILSQVDKYNISITDFSTRFEKYIFTAILGLYKQGATNIQVVDIANYLETNDAAKSTFENQNGIEYLQDIIEYSQTDNFDYYYWKLKKLNLLRDLRKSGHDTSKFYIEDLTDPHAMEVNAKFETLTTTDIMTQLKTELLHLENEYGQAEEVIIERLSDGIDDFFENLKEDYEVGKEVQGKIYSYVINGAEPGALTIRSGSSGLGKTRQAVGDACQLAFPLRFNQATDQWEQIGTSDKVLFIITEQTMKQVKKMIVAYLTGINESKFKYANFTKAEEKLLDQARKIIKDYSDNFIIAKIPNPTIESVKLLVRENCLLHNIQHVFYDYIFIGPSLLREFSGFALRNDEVLLMFATALKDLAVELNVSMFTSTQVNASADDNRNIRNEASLAGGRSTINKADNGAIMARPTKEELEAMESIVSKFGIPNMVTDIFKVRSGAWTQVRIWSKVDLGIMRKEDLFITDARLDLIEDFFNSERIELQTWDEHELGEIHNYIKQLNEE